jgi:hypothetical protein
MTAMPNSRRKYNFQHARGMFGAVDTEHSFPDALWPKYVAGKQGNYSAYTYGQDIPYSGFSDPVSSPTDTDIVFLALGAVPTVSVGNAPVLCKPPQYTRRPSGCLNGRRIPFQSSILSLGLTQWAIFVNSAFYSWIS